MKIAHFDEAPSDRSTALAISSLFEEREAIKKADGIETTLFDCALEHVRNTPSGKDMTISSGENRTG